VATYVYEDAVDPAALRVDITASNALADLSDVTTADIYVISSPSGATPTWTATLSNQSATTLRVSHVFATGDVATPGPYRLLVRLYVGSTLFRCVPVTLQVKAL
jgi:hypothetical protein